MAMQMEDVLLMPVMGIAKLDEVTDVAVVDVGRLGRVQRHACLDPCLLGTGQLAGADALQPDIGRYVHQHRYVADRVRAQKKLFIGARQTVMHWANP